MIAEQRDPPDLPQIMSEEEIDALVRDTEVVDRQYQPPPSDKQLADEALEMLKALFPRIHQNLLALWGTGEGEAYVDGLIVDERGNRKGFPPDVLRGLLVLQRIHFQKFGTFRKVDPWDVGSPKK
jgi:hypothetical protein